MMAFDVPSFRVIGVERCAMPYHHCDEVEVINTRRPLSEYGPHCNEVRKKSESLASMG
jgi:hypothetical protein